MVCNVWVCVLGAIAGIVDQPMQNFQRTWEAPNSAGSTARGVISGVGKGIVGVFTKPIGGAAELVSQTGYGESDWPRCCPETRCYANTMLTSVYALPHYNNNTLVNLVCRQSRIRLSWPRSVCVCVARP